MNDAEPRRGLRAWKRICEHDMNKIWWKISTVWVCISMNECVHENMDACMHVSMYGIHGCMHVAMMQVCMLVCMLCMHGKYAEVCMNY